MIKHGGYRADRRIAARRLPVTGTVIGALITTMLAAVVVAAPDWPAVGLRSAPSAGTEMAIATKAVVSGVVESRVIGRSVEGRAITAYRMGNPASTFKAVVLGNMHGGPESAGTLVTAAILKHAPITGVDLWVIPTMNPDGLAHGVRGNAHGVDLNRNFPVGWTPLPRGDHYSGPSPLSEPEAKSMYAFLNAVRPNRLVSLHQPLDGVDTTDGGARDIPFRNALATNLGLPLKAFRCYSECHGSMTRWLTATQPGAGITVEFPTSPSAAYLSGPAASGILRAIMVGHPSGPTGIGAAAAAGLLTGLFQSLLGRSSGNGGPWLPALVSGARTVTQVAQAIAVSTERRQRLITGVYRACVARNATGVELAAWTTYFDNGSWAPFFGAVCGSAEAVRKAGGHLTVWANRLSAAMLHRAPTASNLANWVSLSKVRGTTSLATSVASGVEASNLQVDILYRSMLGRGADPSGLASYSGTIRTRGMFSLPVHLANSAEYARHW